MTNLFNPPKRIILKLVGLDGNAFALIGAFHRAARNQGWSKKEIKVVLGECMSKDYNHLISTLMEHTIDPDDYYSGLVEEITKEIDKLDGTEKTIYIDSYPN